MYDVIIIGAGIAGAAVARELSKYKIKTIVLDKNNDVANGTTMANSAIIHAGFDAEPYKNKGKFNTKGNEMYPRICEELDVPFKQIGSLVLGFNEEELETLKELLDRGKDNKVKGLRILGKEEVLELEPNLSHEVCGALYAPTAGIVSSWEVAIAMMENAMDNGVELVLECEVTGIEKGQEKNQELKKGIVQEESDSSFKITTSRGVFQSRYIVNCAGVYADKINDMIAQPSFKLRPRKGEYFILDKDQGKIVNHVIFQCPSSKGKGVLVTPTVDGNLLVGPDSEFVDSKEDISTDADRLGIIRETALKTTDKIDYRKVIRSFAGLRACTENLDFVIGETADVKGFYNIAGFESPGLSAAPAVAEYLVNEMKKNDTKFVIDENFNPKRKLFQRFRELSMEEKQQLIEENPSYGRIICRCETITEGEIVDAIRRNAGATTVKGVKKRTRAGMGRCQGGFCEPRVVEILARELGVDNTKVAYDQSDAYILAGKTKEE